MKFNIEFTAKALKDLKSHSPNIQKQILAETIKLESEPFPHKKKVRKIKGIKFACFRLRIDLKQDTFRLFYGIDKDIIYVLRIVSKKDAGKILKKINTTEFPP